MRVALDADQVVFDGAIANGECAYVDADALPLEGVAEVTPLVVSGASESDVAATVAVRRRARAAAAAVGAVDGEVEVVGRGAVASALRSLLAGRVDRSSAPVAVIDLTGDPQELISATRRLADLGTLVLAGDSRGCPVALDLYPDLHLRGLRLVGVSDDEPVEHGDAAWDSVPVPAPADAVLGCPVPLGHVWYRVSTHH